jgi:hypothetical protein
MTGDLKECAWEKRDLECYRHVFEKYLNEKDMMLKCLPDQTDIYLQQQRTSMRELLTSTSRELSTLTRIWVLHHICFCYMLSIHKPKFDSR